MIGALAYGTGYGALSWTEPALDVVEVCRPCVLWDCDGRTYAIDCYLKLLVRLCHIYDTRGGVKTIKAGASQDQILNETRLRNLQLQLIKDLREVIYVFSTFFCDLLHEVVIYLALVPFGMSVLKILFRVALSIYYK